jgi:alcohol dehydrogenase YqhD (iron-dependent ADH family)
MSHDESSRLEKIEGALKRIETALVGDSEMGNPGLVKRVGTVEGKVKILQAERVKFLGAVAGASLVLSILATFIFGH